VCGRFSATRKLQELAQSYRAKYAAGLNFAGNYNVAPTEYVPIILEHLDQEREIHLARFGIAMQMADKKFPLLNLRSEKVQNRDDFKSRRCIIPADGFYEWEAVTPKNKQPWYFSPKVGNFSLAGVWKKEDQGLAFTILTTSANELLEPVHDRMPVILSHNGLGQWLTTDSSKDTLKELLEPYPAGLMQAWKVSKAVNSPRFKEASCINSL
jgi:putative SOS response-associated peptidase YedK